MNRVLLVGLLLILRPSSDLLLQNFLRRGVELVESDASIRLELVDSRFLGLNSSSLSSSEPLLELRGGSSLSWSSRRVDGGFGGRGSGVDGGSRSVARGRRSDGGCTRVGIGSVGGSRGGRRRCRGGGGSLRRSIGDRRSDDGSVRICFDVLLVSLSSGPDLSSEIVPVLERKKRDGLRMFRLRLSDLLEAEDGVERRSHPRFVSLLEDISPILRRREPAREKEGGQFEEFGIEDKERETRRTHLL